MPPARPFDLSRLAALSAVFAIGLVLVSTWLAVVSGELTSALAVLAASMICSLLALIAWQESAVAGGRSLAAPGELDLSLLSDAIAAHRDVLVVTGITVLAALLRLWALDSIPPGLHGDEGWTGIDARRILQEGWIGPYVPSALGQPAGPLYWAAVVLKVTGDSVYAVRFSMALLGIATIPVTYLAARTMFDRTTAVFAALLLAFLAWHLTYSRIAFMVVSWPLIEVTVVWLLFLGIKREKPVFFILAGVAAGLGVYTYNAYGLFLVAIGVFVALWLLQSRSSARLRLRHVAMMGAAAVVVAIPLLLYVADGDNSYFSHYKTFSYLRTAEFTDAGLSGKAELLAGRSWDWIESMTIEARPDGSDGSGAKPILHWSSLVLILVGIGVAVRDIKKLPSQLLLLMLVVLPVAAVITVSGGFRRTLGLAPFLALLMAVPLARAWLMSERLGDRQRAMVRCAVVLALAATIVLNFNYYFRESTKTNLTTFAFVVELAEASKHVASLPGEPYVYFLSDRWGYNYETRRYLAPDLEGEDRSAKFGKRQDFEIDRSRDSVFLLLAPYMDRLEEIKALYPGGREYHGRYADRTIFIGYYLPAEASALPPSPDVLGEERDEERRTELQSIAEALAVYRTESGAYPSTNGQVQSACVYKAIDRLCVLEGQLAPDMFLDPRKDPDRYGYWYKSDGQSFSLYASMESSVAPEDTCPPEQHLRRVQNVMCVRSAELP